MPVSLFFKCSCEGKKTQESTLESDRALTGELREKEEICFSFSQGIIDLRMEAGELFRGVYLTGVIMAGTFVNDLTPVLAQSGLYIGGGVLTVIIIVLIIMFLLRR